MLDIARWYSFSRAAKALRSEAWGTNTPDNRDRIRYADGENNLRGAITGLQQTFMDDPPAIFLAWSVRARAVNKRFAVHVEEGRDILGTLRLWKPPSATQLAAGRN